MPLGQKVKVCGRRFGRLDPSKRGWDNWEGVKSYRLDEERKAPDYIPGDITVIWCGYFSKNSAYVFLCESCAIENGLKW